MLHSLFLSPAHARLRRILLGTILLSAAAGSGRPVLSQTDYYNTDAGRPMQIEDAYPVERRAFEIQAAPLRFERSRSGASRWEIEPEVAYGILPRTHIELGAPFALAVTDSEGEKKAGLSGIHISAFHNLNSETSIPALAIAAGVLLPVGWLAPDDAYFSVRGVLTRTFTWARFHVNGEYTFGSRLDPGDEESAGAAELSGWLAGVAVDRAFPLEALLVSGEVFASEPLHRGEPLQWNTGVGLRYQLDPRVNIDGGIGRRLNGDDRGWYITFGSAYAVGLPWNR